MKQPHFYSHIIQIDEIHMKLDELNLSPNEKQELVLIIESSLHHVVINVILSHLEETDKKTFLSHLAGGDHEGIWKLLKEKVTDIEDKIKQAIGGFSDDLKKDLDEIIS